MASIDTLNHAILKQEQTVTQCYCNFHDKEVKILLHKKLRGRKSIKNDKKKSGWGRDLVKSREKRLGGFWKRKRERKKTLKEKYG